MTLTALRHLVLAGNLVAIAAAAGAGWYAWNVDVEIRDPKEWKQSLPATGASSSDLKDKGPGKIQDYSDVIKWKQGDPPVEEKAVEVKPDVVKVDPFTTMYDLAWAAVCESNPFRSWVTLKDKSQRTFPVGVGRYVPKNPWPGIGETRAWTSWRLDKVWIEVKKGKTPGEREEQHLATFVNDETRKEKTFELDLSNPGLKNKGFEGLELKDIEVPFADKPFEGRQIRWDLEGENPGIEWELLEEEARWLVTYSDEEAKKVGFGESNTDDDGDGKADGFVIKSLAPDSRAAKLGMKAEDRVISVNDKKVDSNEQAIDKGKKDYDAGKKTFKVQVDRSGKILNFTFHAKGKRGKGGKGGKDDGPRRSNR